MAITTEGASVIPNLVLYNRDPLQCSEEQFAQSIKEAAPALCECAKIGKRELSWAIWIPGVSENKVLDWANKEFSHEHIFWEASGDNIGFGQHGLFLEDKDKFNYHIDPTCYDGSVMRQAVAETKIPKWYNFLLSNCQQYVESVMNTYNKSLQSSGEKRSGNS